MLSFQILQPSARTAQLEGGVRYFCGLGWCGIAQPVWVAWVVGVRRKVCDSIGEVSLSAFARTWTLQFKVGGGGEAGLPVDLRVWPASEFDKAGQMVQIMGCQNDVPKLAIRVFLAYLRARNLAHRKDRGPVRGSLKGTAAAVVCVCWLCQVT